MEGSLDRVAFAEQVEFAGGSRAVVRRQRLEGLRVVDVSVFPLVPSSNIHPAVLMTADRAAEMIRAG